MIKHRTCKCCGSKLAVEVWPKELAIRWLYRHRMALDGLVLSRENKHRASWFILGTLFKSLGFYSKQSAAMDIPLQEIVREAKRRLEIGGGCWRDKPRPKYSRELKK